MFFKRIAWQLTSSYIVVILFSMGILGFYMLEALNQRFENDLKDNLRRQAHLLASAWSSYLEEGPLTARARKHLDALASGLQWQNGSRLRVFDGKRRLVLDTGAPEEPTLRNLPDIGMALKGDERLGIMPDENDPDMYVAFPIRVRRPDPRQPSGIQDSVQGVVYVNRSTAYLRPIMQRLRGMFLVGTFISLLFSGTLSLFLSHGMTYPIRAVTKAADKMAAGDLAVQVPAFGNNEIGELGERFNFMARQLRVSTGMLAAEKRKLDVVLSHMADGVIMMEPSGTVVVSNPVADEMLTFPSLDDESHPLHNLRGGMRRCLQTGQEAQNEIALSGGKVARVVYSPVRSARGEILGCVIILHDITELQRLSELKTEFVSNVSHELKTPLASVKALAEVLRDGAVHEPEGEKFLRSIGREVDRMTRLVMDLLNLSKIEAGVVKMEVCPFDLAALARDAASNFAARGGGQRPPIQVTAEGSVWALGDPDRVEQVLVNLLDNAVRYSPSDSAIEVRVRAVGGASQVDVQDHGIGIPPAELSRIFERFYRVDKARSRDQGGTGLGLSIARQIMERLHGRIWAESDGSGSTFSFTLPAVPSDEVPAPTEEILEPHER
ncbi:MAG: cell wall metabolism sensor histidine kinase WalK [Armatimonadetes bacterium]|nr:cell wall metabolism sensor histidine kinase WalK [Armatimonadota bacterium]